MKDKIIGGTGKSQLSLLTARRFLPLFLTQFLGAFNDNFFKSALMMLITYRLGDALGLDPRVLVNGAAGAFILPFFLFAAPASDLADRYDRSRLMQAVKAAEIVIMSAAALGFRLGNLWFLLAALFLMGAQSAFFSPAKYGILPQHLEEDELIAGNGLIQMGTYLAILTGTLSGGLLILRENGGLWVGLGAVAIAAAGWLSSLFIPPTQPIDPARRLSPHVIRRTLQMFSGSAPVLGAMLAVSWFWLVGATFLAQFPAYARLTLGADEGVATAFLAVFSLGIGLGSMACNALLKGRITTRFVPASAWGIALASFLLWRFSGRALGAGAELVGAWAFFASPANWPIPLCLFAIAFFGGLYIVPLYAVMQTRPAEDKVSGVIACSNIMDSLFMTASALGAALLLAWGWEVPQIFLLMAPLTAVAGWLTGRIK